MQQGWGVESDRVVIRTKQLVKGQSLCWGKNEVVSPALSLSVCESLAPTVCKACTRKSQRELSVEMTED